MVNRREQFEVTFNKINHTLKQLAGEKDADHITFTALLKKLEPINALIRRHYDELSFYANLRNILVHEKRVLHQDFLEVSSQIVESIAKIEQQLNQPVNVFTQFQNKVASYQTTQPLTTLLQTINKQHFSQFPIYEGTQFIGILTSVGIANWLAAHSDDDTLLAEIPTIAEVLEYEEKLDAYKFISRETPIYEVNSIFKKSFDCGKRLEILFITQNGKPNEKLLGTITANDVLTT